MTIYHATTPKKENRYHNSGAILSPVRGFTTMEAAMMWALKTGRTIIYKVDGEKAYKLPDHHNSLGEAWWIDCNISINNIKRIAVKQSLNNKIKDKSDLLNSVTEHFTIII